MEIGEKFKGAKEVVEGRAKEGVDVEQGGRWEPGCCSVIDFRVDVLQCYCCDADQIKGETAH